jgi:septum formation protein
MFGIGKSQTTLILASGSTRRAKILRDAGFTFDLEPSDVDESRRPRESPRHHVQRLAQAKARLAAEHIRRKKRAALVIGADTVVLAQGKVLGKPCDVKEARQMLGLLSGRTHRVLTGVSILRVPEGAEVHHVETTRVRFSKLSKDDIDDYIATGEPFDKAGAYGIQGIGGRFVISIAGCYFNVMGLPLARLWSMLRAMGYPEETRRGVAWA